MNSEDPNGTIKTPTERGNNNSLTEETSAVPPAPNAGKSLFSKKFVLLGICIVLILGCVIPSVILFMQPVRQRSCSWVSPEEKQMRDAAIDAWVKEIETAEAQNQKSKEQPSGTSSNGTVTVSQKEPLHGSGQPSINSSEPSETKPNP